MFSIEAFDIKLNTNFVGRHFFYSEELDSTNSFLLNKENKCNTNGTVVLAEKQTKGRGRKDRVWYSAKGQNLTFSVLVIGKKWLNEKINLINFVASLSVAQGIENLYQLRTELKWPNDVLVSGKKIAGILLESVSAGNKIERISVGIGINVNQSFFQGQYNWEPTSIKTELNQPADRERLLAEVLNLFEENLETILKNKEEIMKDWKQRCQMIGEKISIVENDITRYGIFDDVDDDGFLLLRNKNKIEKIHFGDVSIR